MIARRLRVAVTREEASNGPLAGALRRRGMDPVSCPVVDERVAPDATPLRRAAAALEGYDWLVVASARAVTALLEARDGRALPAGLHTAAVGLRTAKTLMAHGSSVPLLAPGAGSDALIVVLRDADRWPGRRALLPRAAEGRRDLGDALRRWGATVDEVVAYRTVSRPPDEIAAAWRAAAPDAVVVASPSAARALVTALGPSPLGRLESVVAIGSTTAMTLESLGVRAMVPPRADFEAVAELLARTYPLSREAPR